MVGRNQEEKMVRSAALAPLLLCLVAPSSATSAPLTKVVEVNGVRLPYAEQGSGEPIVFVHGALSDLRAWEPVGEEIAKKYRSPTRKDIMGPAHGRMTGRNSVL
jgi:hypothetical protein